LSNRCDLEEISTNDTLQQQSTDEFIKHILTLLTSVTVSENLDTDLWLNNNPDAKKLYDYIISLRELTTALAKGDLKKTVPGKGYILANLKALQANLLHLTWQSKMVANGDFSQRVDFLGEFSDAFNEMALKLQNSNMQLVKMATTDTLTQIPNRLALAQFLSAAFKKSVEQDTPFSIIIFDIDNFKRVNDTYGHDIGDKVLVKISEILNSQFRSNDIFSRYGGEEFMAALPGISQENCFKIAKRAISLVSKTKIPANADEHISITVSAGVSSRISKDITYENIIKRSDNALYKAKTSGKNKVCISSKK